MIAISVAIPDILIYFALNESSTVELLWALIYCREILVTAALISLLNQYCSKIWGKRVSLTVVSLLGVANILRIYDANFMEFGSVVGLASALAHIAGLVVISYKCMHYFMVLPSLGLDLKVEYRCTRYLLGLWLAAVGRITLGICRSLGYVDIVTFYTTYTYMVAAWVFLISVSDTQALKAEVNLIQQTLEMKRIFVRYVSHEIRTPLNILNMVLTQPFLSFKPRSTYAKCEILQCACIISLRYRRCSWLRR